MKTEQKSRGLVWFGWLEKRDLNWPRLVCISVCFFCQAAEIIIKFIFLVAHHRQCKESIHQRHTPTCNVLLFKWLKLKKSVHFIFFCCRRFYWLHYLYRCTAGVNGLLNLAWCGGMFYGNFSVEFFLKSENCFFLDSNRYVPFPSPIFPLSHLS